MRRKIAVLSGKGGTGKTTVSANLAAVAPETFLIDCDVEEPNSHIFLKPVIEKTETVQVGYPVVDNSLCRHCRKCADFCAFHAFIAGSTLTLPLKEMCHDCGGCALVCPEGAIRYEHRPLGTVYSGTAGTGNRMAYGLLTTGELSGVRIIQTVKSMVPDDSTVIIDAPPGTSCSTVTATEDADYAVLVAEPTPFGVSDMKMAAVMLQDMGIPFGVVINKAGLGDREIYRYCREEKLQILAEIPFSRPLAEAYAEGTLAVDLNREYREVFSRLWKRILQTAEELHGDC